jgi:hypothetical protein
MLVALLCLTLAVQGAHVCRSGHHFDSGVQGELASPAPVCLVCAIAHSLLFTVFFLLLLLMPRSSAAVFQSVEAKKSSWRAVQLHMRPPPAF